VVVVDLVLVLLELFWWCFDVVVIAGVCFVAVFALAFVVVFVVLL